MTIAESTRLKFVAAVFLCLIGFLLTLYYYSRPASEAQGKPKKSGLYCEDSLYSCLPKKLRTDNGSTSTPRAVLVQGQIPMVPQIIGEAPKVASEGAGLFQLLWLVVGALIYVLWMAVSPLVKNYGFLANIPDIEAAVKTTYIELRSNSDAIKAMHCDIADIKKIITLSKG